MKLFCVSLVGSFQRATGFQGAQARNQNGSPQKTRRARREEPVRGKSRETYQRERSPHSRPYRRALPVLWSPTYSTGCLTFFILNENSSFIQATRIGGHAYRYLAARARRGRVVSSFSGGINLLFEGGEAFVPVQTHAVPLHPWAIQVSGHLLRADEGTQASFASEEIAIGDTVISLANAKVEHLRLPEISNEEAMIALSRSSLLAQFIVECRKTHSRNLFQPQIDAILRRWHESGEIDTIFDLIGLGTGSTPSGDDILVGILSGMSILEHADDQAKECLIRLRASLQETARALTPLPSTQMLLTTCERSFAEPILALLVNLTSSNASEDVILKNVEHVAQLGHQSGLAILSGLTGFLCAHAMLHSKNPARTEQRQKE